jgi:hypothetical protein
MDINVKKTNFLWGSSKKLFYGEDFALKDIFNKYIGKNCKVITKENREEKTHTITVIVSDIDSEEGTITINTKKGIFYLNINTILSIK